MAAAVKTKGGPAPCAVDIGTGSGLLAQLAARTGAFADVVAVEVVAELAETAVQVIEANKKKILCKTPIHVVNAHSTSLDRSKLPSAAAQRDGGARVMVGELLDTWLLGEGALASMRHFMKHLAAPATSGVFAVPWGATVYAQV